MANMCRSRTGDWSVVTGPGLALALGLLYIFVYIFSFSSLVGVVANLRRCLHYHISSDTTVSVSCCMYVGAYNVVDTHVICYDCNNENTCLRI